MIEMAMGLAIGCVLGVFAGIAFSVVIVVRAMEAKVAIQEGMEALATAAAKPAHPK